VEPKPVLLASELHLQCDQKLSAFVELCISPNISRTTSRAATAAAAETAAAIAAV